MKLQPIKSIKYIEAYYSYTTSNKLPKYIFESFGRPVSLSGSFIDMQICWEKHTDKTIFGIVIPKGMLADSRRKPQIKNVSSNLGKKVNVFWDDIFAYDENYSEEHLPTPMVTTGIMEKETIDHVIIRKPNTVNLVDKVNHPQKRPMFYAIPKGSIKSINKSNEK